MIGGGCSSRLLQTIGSNFRFQLDMLSHMDGCHHAAGHERWTCGTQILVVIKNNHMFKIPKTILLTSPVASIVIDLNHTVVCTVFAVNACDWSHRFSIGHYQVNMWDVFVTLNLGICFEITKVCVMASYCTVSNYDDDIVCTALSGCLRSSHGVWGRSIKLTSLSTIVLTSLPS